jgi:hypothetical protein
MPRTQTATRRTGRNASLQLPLRPRIELVPILVPERIALSAGDEAEKSGVTLRQVASFMMTVALLCLLALVAGRMDASNQEANSQIDANSGTATVRAPAAAVVPVAGIGN